MPFMISEPTTHYQLRTPSSTQYDPNTSGLLVKIEAESSRSWSDLVKAYDPKNWGRCLNAVKGSEIESPNLLWLRERMWNFLGSPLFEARGYFYFDLKGDSKSNTIIYQLVRNEYGRLFGQRIDGEMIINEGDIHLIRIDPLNTKIHVTKRLVFEFKNPFNATFFRNLGNLPSATLSKMVLDLADCSPL